MYTKYLAVAKITDPLTVQQMCATTRYSAQYINGLIFCHIPELGYEGVDYIPCRYGLSIPYLRIQQNWKLWVEPTDGRSERWIYTGIADCGGTGGVTPDTNMQMLIKLAAQVIYASGTTLHLGDQAADESLVLGDALQAWIEDTLKAVFDAHVHPDPVSGNTGPPTTTLTAPTDILSDTVFTE